MIPVIKFVQVLWNWLLDVILYFTQFKYICQPVLEYRHHCPSVQFTFDYLDRKCALMEKYIEDSLTVCEEMEKIINVQALHIQTEMNFLRKLNKSTESLKNAITDCFIQQASLLDKFKKEMTNQILHEEVQEKLEFVNFERIVDELKADLIRESQMAEKLGIAKNIFDN